MTSTEDENEKLTPVQLIELQRFEALIVENMRRGEPPVTKAAKGGYRTLTIRTDELDTPAERERTDRHIQLHAELIIYIASEGIDHRHFRGRLTGTEFMFAYQACWILRGRREFFEEPDSFGYAVLTRAGFRPPAARSANP